MNTHNNNETAAPATGNEHFTRGPVRNPLRKRLLRELREDFGKYFVIFALLVGMIGLVSGFLVADESMLLAYQESFAV